MTLSCPILHAFVLCAIYSLGVHASATPSPRCRTQPGDPTFPSTNQLDQFNSSVEGRLVAVVPSGKFCESIGGCSDDQWFSPAFREAIPGSMLQTNWEQDFISNPPSICFRNTSDCGQGNVPILAVNASTAAHIQAGVLFAQSHNLKVAVKASGHDFLGRSTAKNSLLLWTRNFNNITFHDSFKVGGKDMGSAVTVGSGVGIHTLYEAAKAEGKMVVGASGASVVQAGGYLQGGGHALLSPLLGLGADNALEFEIVIANGSFITASETSHPDLFWALRGGGAGSWGVIISATVRTFPTFNAVSHEAVITVNSTKAAAQLAMLHASHIFDWDHLNAGHYFYLEISVPPATTLTWDLISLWPNTSVATVNASLAPFLEKASDLAVSVDVVSVGLTSVNDEVGISDVAGVDLILGSRLIPEDVYRNNISAIGETYQRLLDAGTQGILGHMVAGGQVSRNAHIESAINPKWRTAKTHVILVMEWLDSTPADQVNAIREDLTQNKVPLLDALAGGFESGSYSNEADVREPHFQTKFFGPNYAKLSAIKNIYDPHALFIVGAGVGSENWDEDGLCRLN